MATTRSRNKSVIREVQMTPGLGRHAECSVSKKTPLKRRTRVQTGVCGECVPVRTPRKRENPRMKRLRTSTVEEVLLQVPGGDVSAPPTPLVIKTNPLYATGQTNKQRVKHIPSQEVENAPSKVSAVCDGGRNPLFYGQRRNIRKTKEQEMITAIMDLVEYGEKSAGKESKKKSIVQKAKDVLGRRKSASDIKKHKSPVKKGAFFLRARQRTKSKGNAQQRQTFSP